MTYERQDWPDITSGLRRIEDGLVRFDERLGEAVLSVRDFGATGDATPGGGGTDDTAAILRAAAVAQSTELIPAHISRRLHFPGRLHKMTADLNINTSQVSIGGEGNRSGILFVGAGLTIDGRSGLLVHNALRDIRIRRVGAPGDALAILGGPSGSGKYPTRWSLDRVEVESIGGVALRMYGTFLGTATSVYLRNAATGLVIEREPGTRSLGANAVSFHGGEIQGVKHLGNIAGGIGVSFHGMAWEGSSVGGMDVNDTRGLSIFGPYWEANAAYDLRVGETTVCDGVTLHGGVASVGAMQAKERSVILRRSRGTSIQGVAFLNYKKAPILVDGVNSGLVTGEVRACHPAATVEVASGNAWG